MSAFFCLFDASSEHVVCAQAAGLPLGYEQGPFAGLRPASSTLLHARYQTICALTV
jgi:hypothetical protein